MSNIPEYAKCSICLDVFDDPHAMKACGHIYCRECVPEKECSVCKCTNIGAFPDKNLRYKLTINEGPTMCGRPLILDKHRHHSATCHQCRAVADSIRLSASCSSKTNKFPITKINRLTFVCPLCKKDNLSNDDMVEHVRKDHISRGRQCVVCPICASMPWGIKNKTVYNYVKHVTNRHRFDIALFADLTRDENEVYEEVIRESLKSY
eukprot:GHVL01031293.1.p1 GENE.GHVL01031293.1~~GHVL01031293.1.p1  ORF type:complete len:207 (-),score=15.69 GHVL01031293.1:116-736(-)